jgi:putative nucleotidyltransferase with HDIG domain
MNISIPSFLKEFVSVFSANGKQVFLVGGAVRDIIRGGKAKDWDLATNAVPEEVIAMWRAHGCTVIPTGIKHGTVTVHFMGQALEITTFRTEADYSDGRHPDKTAYTASIEEDLGRRDFTMNAIALEIPAMCVVDPFDGQKDIKNRVIRCVGDPLDRFGEDGLRPLRAARFASQLDFSVDGSIIDAIPKTLSITAKVSPERQRDELDKILASHKPSTGLLLMEETGLLELLLPELAVCRNVEQKGFHRFDVLDHSLAACDFTATENMKPEIRLAALFHDIGKPSTCKKDESGGWTFYNHEKVSADLTRSILTRFRYSNAMIDAVVHLVAEHMFHYEDCWTNAAVRRFIMKVGAEFLPDIYALRRADTFALSGKPVLPEQNFLPLLIERVDAELAKKNALSLKDLAVSGNDLIDIGIKPGPRLGVILSELLESVVSDPIQNTREKLLEIAEKMEARNR